MSVWYARKNNVLVYPTGIIGVLLAAYVYFFMAQPPLYADASLNLYYFLMSVYGWYNWVQKKDGDHYTYPISWCTRKELVVGIGFFLFFLDRHLLGVGKDLQIVTLQFWIHWFPLPPLQRCGGWQNEKLKIGWRGSFQILSPSRLIFTKNSCCLH